MDYRRTSVVRLPLTQDERDGMARDLRDLRRAGVATERPRTFGECMDETGPCPWVSCKSHLAYEVNDRGVLKKTFPGVPVWEMAETCAIKVALANPEGLGNMHVAPLIGMTRARVSQIEVEAMRKLRTGTRKDDF
jgi:hypothetical protein